jgi:hypothetical protein
MTGLYRAIIRHKKKSFVAFLSVALLVVASGITTPARRSALSRFVALNSQRVSRNQDSPIGDSAIEKAENGFVNSSVVATGLVCGLVAALALALWAESCDHSIREPEEIEKYLGISLLAAISQLKSPRSRLQGDPER